MSQSTRGRRNCTAFAAPARVLIGALCVFTALADRASASAQVGRVTSAFGEATVRGGGGGGAARNVGALATVGNNDTVTTGATGAATILLDRKIVLKLDGNTSLRVETRPGETRLHLERGSVEVFKGKGEPNLQLALADPESVIITTGTVFFASFAPDSATGTYACEENSMRVHPRGGNPVVVNAGQVARVRGGTLQAVEALDRNALRQQLKNVARLGPQANRRSAMLAQQRNAVATVRADVGAGPTRGIRPQAALTDLLLARCASLDTLAANPPAELAGRALFTDKPTVTLQVAELTPNGELVQIKARSCTQADLLDHKFPPNVTFSKAAQAITFQLDKLPNIVALSLTFVSNLTGQGKANLVIYDEHFTKLLSPPLNPSPPGLNLNLGETREVQILVEPPAASKPAKAAASANKVARPKLSPRVLVGPIPAVPAAGVAPVRRP